MKTPKYIFVIFALLLLPVIVPASGIPKDFEKPENYPNPLRLKSEIDAYEQSDYIMAPAEGAVLVVGSSSISGWTNRIHSDLAPLIIIPRGFGSSTMYDLLYFSDKIVFPYKPRAILIYEGDNDIGAGVAPQDIRRVFDALMTKIHQNLPATRIYMLAIKPSISRAHLWPEMEIANGMLKAACDALEFAHFVDIATPMRMDGKVQGKFISSDNLHMNARGYDLWRDIVQREMVSREAGLRAGDVVTPR